jgi:hypothetical protein
MQEIYFTVEQIAELLQMHPKTVQRYIAKGASARSGRQSLARQRARPERVYRERAARAGACPGHGRLQRGGRIRRRAEDAIRIANTLTAALNSKPAEYGASRLNTQYIPEERKLRITLYGGARFTAAMLEALALLTGETEQTE